MLGKGWVQRGKFRGKAVLALLVGLGLVLRLHRSPHRPPQLETLAPSETRGAKELLRGRERHVKMPWSLPACLTRVSPAVTPAHPWVAGRCRPPLQRVLLPTPRTAALPAPRAAAHPAPPATQIWLLPKQRSGEMGRLLPLPAPLPSMAAAQPAAEPPYCPHSRFDLTRSRGQYHRRGPGAALGVRQVQPHISG